MRTRSNFYPFISTATIPRRSNRSRIPNIVKPEIGTIAEIVPMADRTMEELLQAPTEGYGEAIVISEILAENFEIKTNLLELVQANKFHGFERDNLHTHISNFKRMTANLKYRDVPNDAIKLMLFPYSLEDTFYNGLTEQDQDSLNATAGGNILNKTTREALKIIKNKLKVRYSRSKSNVSRVNTNSRDVVSKTDDRIDKPAGQISNLVEIVNKQVIAPAKAVEKTCVTCGGDHAYYECIVTDSNPSSVCAATGSYKQINVMRGDFNKQEENLRRNLNNDMRSILGSFFQNQPLSSGALPSNNVPNPKGEMKDVTTRSGLAYEGPSIPTDSPLEKVDEQNIEEILDKEHSNSSGSTAQVQPPVVPISIPKPNVLRTQTKPTISYPSRLNDQKLREKATNQMEKFFQIFHDLHFDISFADALFLMPKLASTIKRMEVCHVLADLGASINLMPLSIWKKISLPELTPTRMTLELADRSITRPKGVAEDVFVKVGKFHFPTNCIVVDFEADPRVPLILGRPFLITGCALIDVYGEEITLRDVLDFQYNSKSSSPTLVSDDLISESDSCKEPIVKSSSPTLTPFGESDFFLEEIDDFLNDDSIPTGIGNSVYDPEGDVLFLEKFLNEDPFQLPPMDLKLAEESKEKSFLKELPSHLEYAFLEDSNKLPVIIAKNLKVDERKALINVLKSHKRAIAWKISNIKGINSRFCAHKILMEDDYKPAVQCQRRVNPKIHNVIKKEVIKLLDVGMIYPISDSPWVSPIHCVPKKGGMTVVANENNELIPTRLVTGWRVCIDYKKLNDATRKDHFPLPFMDQMIERLTGNELYFFLDGFSGCFQIPIDPQDQEKLLAHALMEPSHIDACPFACVMTQDFSKIARPMTHLFKKETPFVFSKDCTDAFNTLKKKLTEAPILVVPDWNLPFELMCDASNYVIEFDITILDKKGSENLAADHLSRLENPHQDVLENKDINENFPLETLGSLTNNNTLEHRAYWALKHVNFDLKTAGDHRKLQLNELSELRDQAYENYVIYKERMKKLHDFKIKNRIFNVGDQVFLFNSCLKIFSGKLKTRWSGPFTITRVFPYGTIELSQPNGLNFKVNGHRVKHYFGGDIPSNVTQDLHTFPMDN
uniref:DNA-directed DNA polymerase n=1 Tax=Tanacetum cinerariifolium TaxID=118510 RepID=A0A6L2J8G6_TANCI|nr:DNA-directed DNA polymerase [Tanacetum cinerariifolium]